MGCRRPAGQVTRTIVPAGKRTDGTGTVHRLQAFRFDGAVCQGCLLRSQCFTAQGRKGRQVLIHSQEGLLQEARALQQSADYNHYRQRRVVAEHRLARLEQLGIRQARYFGRVKTRFQLYLAATVANLTLLANQTGVFGDAGLAQLANVGAIALYNQGFPARFLGFEPAHGVEQPGSPRPVPKVTAAAVRVMAAGR